MTTSKSMPRALSLQEFTVFVRKASPAQIGKLRPEYLPENIPDDLIEMAPYETRSVIENLIFEANALHLNIEMEMEEAFGEQISTALSLSKQEGKSRSHREFDDKVKVLVELYAQSKSKPEVLKTDLAEGTRSELRSLALDLRQESSAYAHGQGHVQKANTDVVDEKYKAVFDKSLISLKKRFNGIMQSMNVYTYVRILEVASEMDYVRNTITMLEDEVAMLKQDVEEKRQTLTTLSGGFISKKRNAHRIEELQKEITDIIDNINRKEVVISEEDLLEWLDVIVDANLSSKVVERAEKQINLAKMTLFTLLQKYCILQEANARQVARNPFSQIDPKQSIHYLMRSEKFILDYFLKKRDSMTTWLGDAAEAKLGALEGIEDTILKELKKNHKLMK